MFLALDGASRHTDPLPVERCLHTTSYLFKSISSLSCPVVNCVTRTSLHIHYRILLQNSCSEFLQPMLTDVLASPISIQIIHEICIASTSCIAVKIPSAVDEEHMHMSRNCELTTPRFSSNMQMVKRFALSTPVSLQPSMANANGSFYIKSTSICW